MTEEKNEALVRVQGFWERVSETGFDRSSCIGTRYRRLVWIQRVYR
jgi:hypothetical protein